MTAQICQPANFHEVECHRSCVDILWLTTVPLHIGRRLVEALGRQARFCVPELLKTP